MHVKTLVLPLSTYAHGAGTVATTGISVLLLVVLVHLPVYVIVANGKSCSQLVLLHEKRLDLANSSYIHLHSAPYSALICLHRLTCQTTDVHGQRLVDGKQRMSPCIH